MRVDSNAPTAFPWLGPGSAAASVGDRREQALWRLLAGGTAPFSHQLADHEGFWRRGWAVAEAPGSQYDALRDLAAQGLLPDGNIFCLAGGGVGFHGRQRRPWSTLPGNLHLAAAVAADLPAAVWAPVLPALPALALLDAVRGFVAADRATGLKWVNDVVLEGAKLGGVLTAARTRDGRIDTVFLGIGLNVAAAPPLPQGPAQRPPTCLAAAATAAVGLGEVLPAVLGALAARWRAALADGPQALVLAYRTESVVVGRRVTVQPETADGNSCAAPLTARVAGIGDDLALLLEGGAIVRDGRLVRVED